MDFLRRQGFRRGQAPVFQQDYRVFGVMAKGRPDLEVGDKILLPESALRVLTHQHVAYPMLFQLTNHETNRTTHCSVMEFSAEEGHCFLPLWMMEHLGLFDGSVVNVKNVTLKKASFVKIQPHKTAFTEISNPKAVLEHRLRTFSCLTEGDVLCIEYNSERFYINVLEVRPDGKACIIETDCEVDFAEPVDYKEWQKAKSLPADKKRKIEASNASVPGEAAAAGGAGKPEPTSKAKAKAAEKEEEEPKFFQSGGYRLDGKKVAASPKKAKPKAKSAKELQREEEARAAYRQRFDEARKAVAQKRALKFGRKKTAGGGLANKHQQFSGVGHTLD